MRLGPSAVALAATAALLAGCSATTADQTTAGANPPPSAPAVPTIPPYTPPPKPTPKTVEVVYEVTSDQPIHSVDYMDEGGFSNAVGLPSTWTKTVTMDPGYSNSIYASVAAQAAWAPAKPTFITCKITANGTVLDTKTGHGEGATVNCHTK